MKILCFRNSKLRDYLIFLASYKLIKKKHLSCEIFYLSDKNKHCKYLPNKIENEIIYNNFIFYKNKSYRFLSEPVQLVKMIDTNFRSSDIIKLLKIKKIIQNKTLDKKVFDYHFKGYRQNFFLKIEKNLKKCLENL
jgi:hypothetical protein